MDKKPEKRKTISPIIGSFLRDLRKERGLSHAALSQKLGSASAGYIGFVELAKRLPGVETLKAYSAFFNVPLDDLLRLREMTIYETYDMLGPDTPLSIKNERNMLLFAKDNAFSNSSTNPITTVNESIDLYKVETDAHNAKLVEVKLKIDKKGNVRINGDSIDINDLPAYLTALTTKK